MSIGAIVGTKEERQKLAKKSLEYVCDHCGPISAIAKDKILELTDTNQKPKESDFEKLLQGFTPAKEVKEKQKEAEEKETIESIQEEEMHIKKMIEES